jgi:ABC-2 type transport system permease protein
VRRLWPLIRREYLERVRTRAFLVATLLGPALFAGITILPGAIMERNRGKALRIAVLDRTGSLAAPVEETLAQRTVNGEKRFEIQPSTGGSLDERQSRLKGEILAGHLDGYVELLPDALEKSTAEYHGRNVSNVMDLGLMETAINEALLTRRLTGEGIAPSKVAALTQKLEFKAMRLTAGGEREDRGATFILAFLLAGMLYTTVAIWGGALMNGVIEEKTNRVVEVMVSSVSPSQLFAGKLLGVGAVGLTQFLVWTLSLALLGAYAAPMMGGLSDVLPEVPPLLLASLIVFFLLGYFLYASLYAAIGASVNTQQEAQSLVFPALMPLILAFVLCPSVLGSPDSTLAIVLSLIPFFSPLLMFVRISALTPPAWQIGLSILLALVAIAAMNWVAARIYRVGILMYGKRPTLPEILKWVGRS